MDRSGILEAVSAMPPFPPGRADCTLSTAAFAGRLRWSIPWIDDGFHFVTHLDIDLTLC